MRRLAAAALAFLLRQMHAQRRLGALTAAVRLVLRQATASGSEARLQAGAALLFHAARGLGHDLNSHAPEVLLRALRGLETGDADPGRVRGPSGEQEATGLAGDESVAAEGLQPDKGDGDPLDRTESATSPAAQRTLRHAAVVAALLDLLLEHVRRDSAAQLWAALHYEALLRLEAAQAAPGDDLAALRAAASLGHVAQALAFHGGSRVGDYGPSLDLMARALGISALLESEAGRGAALRLAAALVAGHSQAAGASSGPVAYAGMASQWAGAFAGGELGRRGRRDVRSHGAGTECGGHASTSRVPLLSDICHGPHPSLPHCIPCRPGGECGRCLPADILGRHFEQPGAQRGRSGLWAAHRVPPPAAHAAR